MSRGPLEFVVVEFPEGVPGTALGPELRRLIQKDVIDLIDMLFVEKRQDGSVVTFEAAERTDDPQYAALGTAAQSIDGLIADQDVAAIADDLAPGVVAGVFLFEHVWMRNLHAIVSSAGGEVVADERISAPVVEAVEALAAAASAQAL